MTEHVVLCARDAGGSLSVLRVIVGHWVGPGDEEYEVRNDWKVVKNGLRMTDITWDAELRLVMWGTKSFFDPQDFEESSDRLRWYSQNDREKVQPTEVWNRDSDSAPDPKTIRSALAPAASISAASGRVVMKQLTGDFSSLQQGDLLRVVAISSDGEVELAPAYLPTASVPGERAAGGSSSYSPSTLAILMGLQEDGPAKEKARWKQTEVKAVADWDAKAASGWDTAGWAASPSSTGRGKGSASRRNGNSSKAEHPADMAIQALTGRWVGAKGEFYEVVLDWICYRIGIRPERGDKGDKFNLSWDKAWRRVLWGSSYFIDPADLAAAEHSGVVSWYRQTDWQKKRPVFTWTRDWDKEQGEASSWM